MKAESSGLHRMNRPQRNSLAVATTFARTECHVRYRKPIRVERRRSTRPDTVPFVHRIILEPEASVIIDPWLSA